MSEAGRGERPEAIEVGDRVWEAFNSGDTETFWELIDPECVIATDARWPDGGEFRGREEYGRFLDRFLEAFSEVRFEQRDEPEVIGEWGLYTGRWVGTGLSSGIVSEGAWFSVVFRAIEGRIREARFFFAEDEAREFAGG